MQNETEEGTNRLQKRKQDRATETVMSEQEYLKFYEHIFTQQVQMKMSKNQMSS
jgi:hypothetical protein